MILYLKNLKEEITVKVLDIIFDFKIIFMVVDELKHLWYDIHIIIILYPFYYARDLSEISTIGT